jgi:thiamine-monophosphate kinase
VAIDLRSSSFEVAEPLRAGWHEVGLVASGDGVTVDGAAPEGGAGHRHY